jgi:uncharacterized lipoprotein YehR (DUF1307 family)
MFKKSALLILALVMIVALFAGCGEKELKTITVNEVTHSVQAAP